MTTALDEPAVSALGEQLGRTLPTGSVVWLDGALGAGKTTLARAIVRGRGVVEAATSPTYAIVHHYEGPAGAVYHLDCYRLRAADDAADLDWAALAAADLLLIEWPERAGPWAPPATTRISLALGDGDTRVVAIT